MTENNAQDLDQIFIRLKTMIGEYSPPFTVKQNSERNYDLWSIKDLVIEGRKRKEVYFASVIIQKSYVGFYFMPVYTDEELIKVFKPELLKLKKGLSCFHIKKLDQTIEKQIADALKLGFELYVARGWVDPK
ncbi:MAG TPA: hypothetical protein VN226_03300 [Anaerolineales bacterium]|nr:hypothetical protein [Anaerolineales bacterium]